MTRTARLALIATVVLLAIVGTFWFASRVIGVGLYGCTLRDHAWSEQMARDPGAAAVAETMRRLGPVERGCDSSERIVRASAPFKTSDTPAEVHAMADRTVTEHGWKPHSDRDGSCFQREIDGQITTLVINVQGAARDREINVEVSLFGKLRHDLGCSPY